MAPMPSLSAILSPVAFRRAGRGLTARRHVTKWRQKVQKGPPPLTPTERYRRLRLSERTVVLSRSSEQEKLNDSDRLRRSALAVPTTSLRPRSLSALIDSMSTLEYPSRRKRSVTARSHVCT